MAPDRQETRESSSAGEPSGWFLIVRDGTCTECGLTASSVGAKDLGSAIIAEALHWVELINSLSHTSSLTTRPRLDVWSALEYAGHASDTLALFTDRIRLALTVEDPQFEFQDQDAEVINERYNDQNSDAVAGRILASAQALGVLLDTLPEEGWQRTGTRLEGERFDVTLLGRFALHEARHHRLDAERSAQQ